jgi:hypothetical protein
VKKLPKSFEAIREGVEHGSLAIFTLARIIYSFGPAVVVDIDHGELRGVSEARSVQ